MTKVTAHSGCEGTQAGSGENIMTALGLGADVIEMDLRALNGEVYLSHDPPETEHQDACLTFRKALELLRENISYITTDRVKYAVLQRELLS